MIIDGIIALLTADSGVNALISGRIYKNVLPRGYNLPAVAVHRYGGAQDYDFAGPVGVQEDQIQFDCYADDANTAQQVSDTIRDLLEDFTGALPDNSIVQGCYLERDMDMPFLPHADTKSIAHRALLAFRIVSVRA